MNDCFLNRAAPLYQRARKLLHVEPMIHDHAATGFEDFCRGQHPGAARYWKANVEFDYVRDEGNRAVVSEVKFKRLSTGERRQLEQHLAAGWQASALARRFRDVRFEVLDASILG